MTGAEDIVDLEQARRVITQLRDEQDEAVEKAVAPLKRQVLELARVNAQQRLQEGRLDTELARLRGELAQRGSNNLFNRKLVDLESRGYEVIGRILHKEGQYALFDSSCRWLSKEQYQRLMHEQDGSLFAPRAQPDSERDAALADEQILALFETGLDKDLDFYAWHGQLLDKTVGGDSGSAQHPGCTTKGEVMICAERDWPADYASGENQYECCCSICGNKFFGHKARRICQVCASTPLGTQHPNGEVKWCSYCQKNNHNDSECWCTRRAPATADPPLPIYLKKKVQP